MLRCACAHVAVVIKFVTSLTGNLEVINKKNKACRVSRNDFDLAPEREMLIPMCIQIGENIAVKLTLLSEFLEDHIGAAM